MARRVLAGTSMMALAALLVLPSLADEQIATPPDSSLWDSEAVIAEDDSTVTTDPLEAPTTMDDCRDGGWQALEFRNQGQCIRFVNTGKDSR